MRVGGAFRGAASEHPGNRSGGSHSLPGRPRHESSSAGTGPILGHRAAHRGAVFDASNRPKPNYVGGKLRRERGRPLDYPSWTGPGHQAPGSGHQRPRSPISPGAQRLGEQLGPHGRPPGSGTRGKDPSRLRLRCLGRSRVPRCRKCGIPRSLRQSQSSPRPLLGTMPEEKCSTCKSTPD